MSGNGGVLWLAMGEPEQGSFEALLKSFDLGPQWAKGGGRDSEQSPDRRREEKRWEKEEGDGRRQGRDGAKGRQPRREFGGDRQGRRHEGGRDRRGGGQRGDRDSERRGGGRHHDLRRRGPGGQGDTWVDLSSVEGVAVRFDPAAGAVNAVTSQIRARGMTCSLYDLARLLVVDPVRCRATLESSKRGPEFFAVRQGGEGVFLSREEATAFFWTSDLRHSIFEEEEVEVPPPPGVFVAVARCGMSGEWLGPPNHHTYGENLRRLHRERFSHMRYEEYAARVRTERGEEAVEAWRQTMTRKLQWRVKGDTEKWIDSEPAVRLLFRDRFFDQVFEQTKRAAIGAAPPPNACSPPLREKIKRAWFHARKHPERLIPTLCRLLEAGRMPVFKLQGKLYTGPARPHSLPEDRGAMADRPAALVNWILSQEKPKLADLWPAVLPEGLEKPSTEWASDFHWLLSQGHLLHFPDDTLRVMVRWKQAPPAKPTEPTEPTEPAPQAEVAEEASGKLPTVPDSVVADDQAAPAVAPSEPTPATDIPPDKS